MTFSSGRVCGRSLSFGFEACDRSAHCAVARWPAAALAEKVQHSGARLVVMVIPDEFPVDPRVLALAARHAGTRPEDYDLDRPQRELTNALAARRIPALDLLPASRRATAAGSLYLPRNTHWKSAGNRLAASELARFLIENRLVP